MFRLKIPSRISTRFTRSLTLQAEPFDPSSLAGSSPAHNGHIIVHTSIPPKEWPSKVLGLSKQYDDLVIDKSLRDAGVLVGLAYNSNLSEDKNVNVYPTMKNHDGSNTSDIISMINEDKPANDNIHIYICTHGSRDCRCSQAGEPTVKSLREEIEKIGASDKVKVFEISHVGGHKWAANALVFPQGDWYGNLRPWDSPKFLKNIMSNSIHWPHWRGRMKVDPEFAVEASKVRSLDLESCASENKEALDAEESDIVKIKFRDAEGEIHEVDGLLGETLMNVGRREKLGNVEGVCDGHLECATCHMYFPEPDSADAASFLTEIKEEEEDMLQYAIGYDDQRSRLGCQIKITPELANWCSKGGIIDLPKY